MGRLFNHILCVLSPNITVTVVSVRHTELNTLSEDMHVAGPYFCGVVVLLGAEGGLTM